MLALKKENMKTLCVGGGVLCNDLLRSELKKKCEEENIELYLPDKVYCKMCIRDSYYTALYYYLRRKQ